MTLLAGFLSAFWAALALSGTLAAMAAVQPGLNAYGTPDLDRVLRPELAASTHHGEEVQPPPPSDVEDLTEPDPTQPTDGETPPEDEVSIGEIPVVQMVELTPETAQKAVDAYVIVKDKYKDAATSMYSGVRFDGRTDEDDRLARQAKRGPRRKTSTGITGKWWFWTIVGVGVGAAVPLVLFEAGAFDASGRTACPDGDVCGTVLVRY
jgi:hypothetical protein